MSSDLTQEIVDYLTGGWSNWERKNLWEEFKEEEIKEYFPLMYNLIKDVKELERQ